MADTHEFVGVVRRSLAPSTWASYRRVLNQFADYTRSHGLRVESGDSLMASAAAFLGSKIREGYAAAFGRQLQMALRLQWPEWVNHVRPLDRALRGWEKARPIVKRPPLIRPLAVAMAMRLVLWGYPLMGVAIMLSFHCYFRISELLAMERWHVVPARDARTGFTNRFSFVHIPKSKTGTQQDVEIHDPVVDELTRLAVRVAELAGRARLFPYSEHRFRKVFRQCVISLGMAETITPHSMRHGGATHDYSSQRLTTDEIRIRGRWRSEKSMHHYVGSMRSALANLTVPKESVWCGVMIGACLRDAFVDALAIAPTTPEVSTCITALGSSTVPAVTRL